MYAIPNNTGRPREIDLTEADCLNTQSVKQKLLNTNGSGVSVYILLKQLRTTFSSLTNSDYAVSTPKFISIDETSCPHYGPSLRIQAVLGNNSGQLIKYIMKYHLTTKQVE